MNSVATTVTPNRSRLNRLMRRVTWTPYLLLLPAMTLVIGILGWPLVEGFVTSLHMVQFYSFETPFVGLQNYADLMQSPTFRNSLLKSGTFVFGSVIGGTLVAFSFALVLYHLRHGQHLVRAIALIPYLVSGIAAAVVWRFLFSGTAGLANYLLGGVGIGPIAWLGSPAGAMFVAILANIWYISPFSTLILLAGLQTIDRDYYDAAALDGAVGWLSFRYITVPLIAPMIAVSLVWLSFASFNSFALILTLTAGGPGRSTEVLAVYMYKLAFQSLDYSTGAAVMIVLMLLNIVLSAIYLKVFRV